MLSHAGLILFLFSVALLLGSRAAMHTVSLKRSGTPLGRVRSHTVSLEAAGDGEPGRIALWMRVGVTGAVLASALFIVLSKHYEADQQKWAFGVIGTVLGYWLRP